MATGAPALSLPETIVLDQGMSLTPNEMRQLKTEAGRSLTELLGGDPEDMDAAPDRIQALVWVALRRDGYSPSWEEAGDVRPDFREPMPDPTRSGPSVSSSTFADSGA